MMIDKDVSFGYTKRYRIHIALLKSSKQMETSQHALAIAHANDTNNKAYLTRLDVTFSNQALVFYQTRIISVVSNILFFNWNMFLCLVEVYTH